MASRSYICPSCGSPVERGEAVRGLCASCYVKRFGVARLPGKVSFVYCKGCGSYRYQGGWNEGLWTVEEAMKEFLWTHLTLKARPSEGVGEVWVEEIEIPGGFSGPGLYRALVRVAGSAGGSTLSEERVVEVEASAGLCPRCAARAGGGYEAEVKVRGIGGALSEESKDRVYRVIRGASAVAGSIVKVEEREGGIDVYLADKQSARILAGRIKSAMGGEVAESFKLVGRKPSGKRKGRLTISVRVPDFRPGELILVDGRPHLYLAPRSGGILAVDLEEGVERVVKLGGPGARVEVRRPPRGPWARRLMLLSGSPGPMVFLDLDKGPGGVVEVPGGRVEVLIEAKDLEPGRVYLAYMTPNRLYILGVEDSGGEEGG